MPTPLKNLHLRLKGRGGVGPGGQRGRAVVVSERLRIQVVPELVAAGGPLQGRTVLTIRFTPPAVGRRLQTTALPDGGVSAAPFYRLDDRVEVVLNQSRFHEVPSYALTGKEKKAKDQPSLVTVTGQGVAEEPERFPEELMAWNTATDPTAVLKLSYHTQSWARLKRKLVEMEE